MPRYRERTLQIRDFIERHVEGHPKDITAVTANEFSISRTAVLRHMRNLIDDGVLVVHGRTKDRSYELRPRAEVQLPLRVTPELEEDRVWRQDIRPLLEGLPDNILSICQYGLTEMLNNVVDHSGADTAVVELRYTAALVELRVVDFGVGIFRKIQAELRLEDPRHVVLELSKGKLTTDPDKHTGEGIFFASRVFDQFSILSHGLCFSRANPGREWLFETNGDEDEDGHVATTVTMGIGPRSERMIQDVFDLYAAEGDDYSFSRTLVPVDLARYSDENLVSRSQAKRLLARLDRFREVILDFEGVETIGQAFADEIFRVHSRQYPQVHIVPMNMNDQVVRAVLRAVKDPLKWTEQIERVVDAWAQGQK